MAFMQRLRLLHRASSGAALGACASVVLWLGFLLLRAGLQHEWPSLDWIGRELSSSPATYLWFGIGGISVSAAIGGLLGLDQDELLSQSLTDVLTGLPNRRHLNARLAEELARANRRWTDLALLFVDLDQLKRINDTMGHHAGDAAIRAMAGALRRGSRTMDFAARFGGDEFVVLAPATTIAQAMEIARRIQRELPRAVDSAYPDVLRRLSASIGVAGVDGGRPVPSAEELFSAADDALREAKSMGGQCEVASRRRFGAQAPESEDAAEGETGSRAPAGAGTGANPHSSPPAGGVSPA